MQHENNIRQSASSATFQAALVAAFYTVRQQLENSLVLTSKSEAAISNWAAAIGGTFNTRSTTGCSRVAPAPCAHFGVDQRQWQ